MNTVLVIDDNPAVGIALDVLLGLHDIRTVSATSPEAGLALLDSEPVDLVLQDMNFTADTTSGEEGVALFEQIRARHPDLPVILLTAWTHIGCSGRPRDQGRRRGLPRETVERRPQAAGDGRATWSNWAEVRKRALNRRRAGRAARAATSWQSRYDLRGLVWADPATGRGYLNAGLPGRARSDVPVLITGPNGSGQGTHRRDHPGQFGRWRTGRSWCVNCGALPVRIDRGGTVRRRRRRLHRRQRRHARASSRRPTAAPCSSTRSATCRLAGQMKLLRVLETGKLRASRLEPRAAREGARDQRHQRRPGRDDP